MPRVSDARPDDAPEPAAVQRLLDRLPPPAEPLDVVMLDGLLCAVLLREHPLPAQRWLPFVFDLEGRAVPATSVAAPLRGTVLRRHAALARAIASRQWFDPWVFELDDGASPADAAMPWAAGFAFGAERFALPAVLRTSGPGREALALIYQFVDADDWPDAAALADEVGVIEPPSTLADAVEDLVRAVLLAADAAGLPAGGAASGPR